MGPVMKTLALTSTIISLSAATLVGQSQSDIDFLRARADAHERKISQLERELIRLKAYHADESATAKAATPPKAVPVSESLAENSPKKSSPAVGNYVVKKGDMLSRIAYRHNTSVASIKKENSLNNDIIQVGQKLRLPSASIPEKTQTAPTPAQLAKHTVKSGDTFYSIARDHKVSVSSLRASNPELEPTRMRVGQTLVIDGNAKVLSPSPGQGAPKPSKSKVASKVPEVKESAPVTKSGSKPAIRTITVNQQMTYGQFASRYNASTTELNDLNGLSLNKTTMLAKGSELYVPKY